ncbi:MAG: hypothetical protein AAGM22_13465 [Acidobacteriota bacterium]
MKKLKSLLSLSLAAGLLATAPVAAESVVLVGGGLTRNDSETHRQIFKRRIQRRPLCIIASAHPSPLRAMNAKVSDFERHMGARGPKFVLGLPLREESAKATNPAVVNSFGRCGGFFFTDGDARRIYDRLMPGGKLSATTTLIRRAGRTGAVVAGTGAGAAAVADLIVTDGGSAEALAHGIAKEPTSPGLKTAPGMSFWPGVAVEVKALAEGRFGRLLVLTRASEQRLGFGIDVGTALIVDGVHGKTPRAKVYGTSQVIAVDTGDGTSPERFFLLASGDGFDLAGRRGVPHEDREAVTASGSVEPLEGPWRQDAFHRGLVEFATSVDASWKVGAGAGALEIGKGEGFRALGSEDALYAGPFEIR